MGKVEQVRDLLEDPFVSFKQLTDDERRVLRLASRGFTNRYISQSQGISEEMVAYVLRNGLLKLNVKKKDLPNIVFALIGEIVG
jgi:DNA-binding NarL/FixJ family response regulator